MYTNLAVSIYIQSPVGSGRLLVTTAHLPVPVSGVTPIGQGWTNARGLQGLGGPKPDPIVFIVYFNVSSVGCQPSIRLYS